MNTRQIKWSEFKEMLLLNPTLDLQFQYADNRKVAASYHITEIKQAPITSVDCGGVINAWTEVIIQLWEPEAKQQERPMKARKALSIIDTVEKALPLNPFGVVKIEFGNADFETRQMHPAEFIVNDEELVINLMAGTVQCKAQERGDSCGTGKPKIALKDIGRADACCQPGAGCC